MNSLLSCRLDPEVTFHKTSASEGKIRSVAVVDSQYLSRDYLSLMLSRAEPGDFSVSTYMMLEEIHAEEDIAFDLIILCTHYKTEELAQQLLAMDKVMPAPVLLISDQPASELAYLCRKILKAGIAGIISTVDSRFETVRAAASFVMSGGTLLPRDFYLEGSSTLQEAQPADHKPSLLTQRQRDVFALMQKGKPNKIISYELGVSTSTIKVHVRAIMTALGATNRTEAVFKGKQLGPGCL